MKPFAKRMAVTVGGLGLLPIAPGTWGSLLPLFIVLGCGHFQCNPALIIGILIALIIVSSIVTVSCAPWYTEHFGQRDPKQVVSDEVAGQSIALLGMAWLIPPLDSPYIWIGFALLAFALFRLFDIWKPWLIDKSQHFKAGYGVLMDDILAGLFSGALVLIAIMLSR